MSKIRTPFKETLSKRIISTPFNSIFVFNSFERNATTLSAIKVWKVLVRIRKAKMIIKMSKHSKNIPNELIAIFCNFTMLS